MGKIQSSADISGGEVKKKRFVWTVKNHSKFVQAVNFVGFDKATPKKIMLAMNMPNELTRDIVSSHWQKYKSRLLKEAKAKAEEEEEHRRPYQLENNGLIDIKVIISTETVLGSSTTDHLQVDLHDHRLLSHPPQSFDFSPPSHHNGSINFFGNYSNHTEDSTVAAARSDRCGYGRVTVESDPLEFTVEELIDNIDN